MAERPLGETILEYKVSGQFGQISAIDVTSGLEVSVVVPASCSKQDRERLALRKLAKALAPPDQSDQIRDAKLTQNDGKPPSSPNGRGLIA
jgi:hypothetical protein